MKKTLLVLILLFFLVSISNACGSSHHSSCGSSRHSSHRSCHDGGASAGDSASYSDTVGGLIDGSIYQGGTGLDDLNSITTGNDQINIDSTSASSSDDSSKQEDPFAKRLNKEINNKLGNSGDFDKKLKQEVNDNLGDTGDFDKKLKQEVDDNLGDNGEVDNGFLNSLVKVIDERLPKKP